VLNTRDTKTIMIWTVHSDIGAQAGVEQAIGQGGRMPPPPRF